MKISSSVLQLCFKVHEAETRQFGWFPEGNREELRGVMELLPRVFSLAFAHCPAAETLYPVGFHMQRIAGLRMKTHWVSFFWRQFSHLICPLTNGELRSHGPVQHNFPHKASFYTSGALPFVKALSPLTWSIKNVFFCRSHLLYYIDFLLSVSPHRKSHVCYFKIYKFPLPKYTLLKRYMYSKALV